MSLTSQHNFYLHDGVIYSPMANEFGGALRLEVMGGNGKPGLYLWLHADRPELLRNLARECLKAASLMEQVPAKKYREGFAQFIEKPEPIDPAMLAEIEEIAARR